MFESQTIFNALGHEDSHIGHENKTPEMSLCIHIAVCYVE